MGGNSSKTIIAIVIVAVLLGAVYLWYTGGSLGSIGGRGGAGYQPLTAISSGGGGGGGGKSSSTDWSEMLMPLALMGGIGGLGSIFSKRRWGSWAPWNRNKNVIELSAAPVEGEFRRGELTSIITAKFKKNELLDRPVTFTICKITEEGSSAELYRMDGTVGHSSLEVGRGARECESVSVRLKISGREKTSIQVCARVNMWGGKTPHGCVIVTANPPGTPAPPVTPTPPPAPVTPTPGVIPTRYRTLIVRTHPDVIKKYFTPGTPISIKAIIKETEGNQDRLVPGLRINFTYHGSGGLASDHADTTAAGYAENTLTVGAGRNAVRVESEDVNNNPHPEFEVWGGEEPDPKRMEDMIEAIMMAMNAMMNQLENVADKKDIEDLKKEIADLKKQAEELAKQIERKASKEDLLEISKKIDELQKKLLETLSEIVEKEIGGLSKKIDELAAKAVKPEAIEKITKGIAALKEQLEQIKKQMAELGSATKEIKERIKGLRIDEKLRELEKRLIKQLSRLIEKKAGELGVRIEVLAATITETTIKNEFLSLKIKIEEIKTKEKTADETKKWLVEIQKSVQKIVTTLEIKYLPAADDLLIILNGYLKTLEERNKTTVTFQILLLLEILLTALEEYLKTHQLPAGKSMLSIAGEAKKTPAKPAIASPTEHSLRIWAVSQSAKKRYAIENGKLHEMPLKPLHEKVTHAPINRIELPEGDTLILCTIPEDPTKRARIYQMDGQQIKSNASVRFALISKELQKEDKAGFKEKEEGGAFVHKIRVRKGETRYHATFSFHKHKLKSAEILVVGM